VLKNESESGPGFDQFDIAGFVTRHRLSLVFKDWRILNDLLAWLSAEQTILVSMNHHQSASSGCEAALLLEGIRAEFLNEWICRAVANGHVTSARLEHLLTALDPSDLHTHAPI
jgi:hypothetical protein